MNLVLVNSQTLDEERLYKHAFSVHLYGDGYLLWSLLVETWRWVRRAGRGQGTMDAQQTCFQQAECVIKAARGFRICYVDRYAC